MFFQNYKFIHSKMQIISQIRIKVEPLSQNSTHQNG